MKHHNYLNLTLTIDEEQVEVRANYTYNSHTREFELGAVERDDNDEELILTTDLHQEVWQALHDSEADCIANCEGDYADYCYEMKREQEWMERSGG